jgi:uncharacterized membrane protein
MKLYQFLVQVGNSKPSTSGISVLDPNSPTGYDFVDLANKFVAYAILIAGFLSVVFMFVGGISFILSGGKDEKVKQAIATIRYALIGLVVTIISITVINLVGMVFGFELINYLSFSYIIETVNNFFSS